METGLRETFRRSGAGVAVSSTSSGTGRIGAADDILEATARADQAYAMGSYPSHPPPKPRQIDHLLSLFPINPKPETDCPAIGQTLHPAGALSAELSPVFCRALHLEPAPCPTYHPSFDHCSTKSQKQHDALAAVLHQSCSSCSTASAASTLAQVSHQFPFLKTKEEPQVRIPQGPCPGGASYPSSSKKRKRVVTGVVRATCLSPADHLRRRAIVRRARLTFEALRSSYQRQDNSSGASNRNDLRASSKMLSAGMWLHRDVRIVGDIPGVLVGDAFFYRAEMCVVGLHTAPQAGIGYIPGKFLDVGEPVATSIVSSGGYIDDEDTGDVLIYTGSGGRQRNHLDHNANQKLERGNLALHNSYLYGLEVRVIRGHKNDQGAKSKVYVYDGLYKVVESTFGPGKSGHDVCKFKLLRIPGQQHLPSKDWHTAKMLKDTMAASLCPPGYISKDLSQGAEVFCIPVCNNLDNDISPLSFDYTPHSEFPIPSSHTSVKQHWGCQCTGGCCSNCRCVRKNGGGPVYTADGTLVFGRPVVYECGDLCECPMTCVNRLTQRGMKHRLEVFRSKETGWGVRALDLIQPGAFVCEFTGRVVVINEQRDSGLMEGISIIDPRRFPERWKEWGDAAAVEPDMVSHQFIKLFEPAYVLDVSHKSNVACYISHSRTPNVYMQLVSRGNEDESFPHMMVFATETILPMRELSIDYGIDGDFGAI